MTINSEKKFNEQWEKDKSAATKRIFEWMVENFESYRNRKIAASDTATWTNGMYCQGLTRLPDTEYFLMQVDSELQRRIQHDHWEDIEMI